jgi:hypothetical protein
LVAFAVVTVAVFPATVIGFPPICTDPDATVSTSDEPEALTAHPDSTPTPDMPAFSISKSR